MWETLYPAEGSGLAAPQVGHAIRLFIVDSKEIFDRMKEEDRKEYFDGDEGVKETFINAKILEYSEKMWKEDEGCLSVPGISELVERPWTIIIEYSDKDFQRHTATFSGTTARVIQHEYDHTEGKLYIDYLHPLKKRILKNKLNSIIQGQVKTRYPMQ